MKPKVLVCPICRKKYTDKDKYEQCKRGGKPEIKFQKGDRFSASLRLYEIVSEGYYVVRTHRRTRRHAVHYKVRCIGKFIACGEYNEWGAHWLPLDWSAGVWPQEKIVRKSKYFADDLPFREHT